jgi:hypothetical protein
VVHPVGGAGYRVIGEPTLLFGGARQARLFV